MLHSLSQILLNFTATSNDNNSTISHHRKVAKEANEKYCNKFGICWVVWGNEVNVYPLEGSKKQKNQCYQFLPYLQMPITQVFLVIERSPKWQIKSIAMLFGIMFLGVIG